MAEDDRRRHVNRVSEGGSGSHLGAALSGGWEGAEVDDRPREGGERLTDGTLARRKIACGAAR